MYDVANLRIIKNVNCQKRKRHESDSINKYSLNRAKLLEGDLYVCRIRETVYGLKDNMWHNQDRSNCVLKHRKRQTKNSPESVSCQTMTAAFAFT